VGTAIRVAMLGCGTVGGEVVRLLREQAGDLAARVGASVELVGVAVRHPRRHPELGDLLTTDASALVTRPDVDVVVEVIGGIEPARELILTALRHGKPVVTANKELLANVGTELFSAADEAGQDLLFEAAVAGGIPLIRALRESLRGEPLRRVLGIVNGTTNYILTKMSEEGADYGDALAEAQRLGFAERDPTADVEGFDAGAKAAIIATIASTSTRNSRQSANIAGSHACPFGPLPRLTSNLWRVASRCPVVSFMTWINPLTDLRGSGRCPLSCESAYRTARPSRRSAKDAETSPERHTGGDGVFTGRGGAIRLVRPLHSGFPSCPFLPTASLA
jgi:hypothetical protein